MTYRALFSACVRAVALGALAAIVVRLLLGCGGTSSTAAALVVAVDAGVDVAGDVLEDELELVDVRSQTDAPEHDAGLDAWLEPAICFAQAPPCRLTAYGTYPCGAAYCCTTAAACSDPSAYTCNAGACPVGSPGRTCDGGPAGVICCAGGPVGTCPP